MSKVFKLTTLSAMGIALIVGVACANVSQEGPYFAWRQIDVSCVSDERGGRLVFDELSQEAFPIARYEARFHRGIALAKRHSTRDGYRKALAWLESCQNRSIGALSYELWAPEARR